MPMDSRMVRNFLPRATIQGMGCFKRDGQGQPDRSPLTSLQRTPRTALYTYDGYPPVVTIRNVPGLSHSLIPSNTRYVVDIRLDTYPRSHPHLYP